MRILSLYMGKAVILSVLLVLLLLLGIESFLLLMGELHDIGKGNYHFLQALLNVPLLLPTSLYELFPMAALIGSLFALGRLANQHELIVMSAAGVSRWQIIRAMLLAAFVALIMMTGLGEGAAPALQSFAKEKKELALSGGQSLKTQQGVWFRDGNNFIFVEKILFGNRLENITRYQFDQNKKMTMASHAASGQYGHNHWYFYDVSQSMIFSDHIESQTFGIQRWDIQLDKRLLGVTNVKPNEMSLKKLWGYLHYRHQNDLGGGPYEFAFWRRIVQPLSTLVMIFLAVPFIFGPLRSVSMGLRIVTGVVVGFTFYILNQFFGPMSQVYQLPASVAACFPTILFAIIGFILLFLKA